MFVSANEHKALLPFGIPMNTLETPRMNYQGLIADLLKQHTNILSNADRTTMIQEVVENGEAFPSKSGALATWTAPDSTGRSPKDTLIVRRSGSEKNIDWEAPNNIALDPGTFDLVFEDAINTLKTKEKLYVTDRVVGADVSYAMPVRVVGPKALTHVFADNMFRATPDNLQHSIFADKGFTVLSLPLDKLDPKKYEGKLRKDPRLNGTSTMVIALDFDNRLGVIYGSNYCGTLKKMMFTVMNYCCPLEKILSLHCSANEGKEGDTALLLGLSGTGKTTLSADPRRSLLGDDEHGWNDSGIANYENGCYAKLINLDAKKEPEIYKACFHDEDWKTHGAIIENAMMFPNGDFDLDDGRLTENSRASYLLSAISNVKNPPVGTHPKTILFLTADANGVLPPIAKLTREQAMLWFLMGYTCKLAGTETGITEPVSTFSRFFGAPFMPLKPHFYTDLLGEKMDTHGTDIYLVNTGWSGGPYGEGKRMDIDLTRAMVHAALSGELKDVDYQEDSLFHVMIPKTCPGVDDANILNPINTWKDSAAYQERAKKLANEFSDFFDKAYGESNIDSKITSQCPGK